MKAIEKLYVLDLRELRTYLFVILFTAGNVLLPQLCHLIPNGGLVWLPIYFFTLVGTYKYGWKVGFAIAVLSPLVNSLFFGMPMAERVAGIIIKSLLLVGAASFVAMRVNRVSILGLLIAVLFYQVVGTMIEWVLVKDFFVAIQDFRIGVPGMIFQVFGGYLFLKAIARI